MNQAVQSPFKIASATLAVVHYPCSGQLVQSEPLVLLHGWGSDSRIWQTLLPMLTPHFDVLTVDLPGFGDSETDGPITLENTLALLSDVLPERCSLLGWSLGGMLATAFASRYPQRVSRLITLASNACFTQQSNWQAAMPISVFREFSDFFQQQPRQCLKRFHGLQSKGDTEEKALLKMLRSTFDVTNENDWQQALALLGELDNRENLRNINLPVLHVFGEQDALVPVAAADEILALNSNQAVEVFESAGHVFPLSCAQKLADTLLAFLRRSHYHLDKQKVAESFSRAAKGYDGVARLQRQVGHRLLELLPDNISPKRIVDLGCGTGYFTELLAEKYPEAEIFGLDLAQGMLQFARDSRDPSGQWLCGDAESLPLADNSIDLIFSSLAFQWCEQLAVLAEEINRVLSPQGVLAFTALAEGTLQELRTSWAAVDNYVHVNQFNVAGQWRDSFTEVGLSFQSFQTDTEVLQYRDVRQLTNELKGLGAHNINSGQNPRLTGREQLRLLVSTYEQFRDYQGQLPATWQVIYGVADKELAIG